VPSRRPLRKFCVFEKEKEKEKERAIKNTQKIYDRRTNEKEKRSTRTLVFLF